MKDLLERQKKPKISGTYVIIFWCAEGEIVGKEVNCAYARSFTQNHEVP